MQQVFIFALGGIVGATATFLLQKYGCSVVVASCVVGLAGALLGHSTQTTHLPLVIFAGSFVGMTSPSVGTLPLVMLAGLGSGVLYHISTNIFAGFGGRLGTIAFLRTTATFYLLWAMTKLFRDS